MSREAHWHRVLKHLARFRAEDMAFSCPDEVTQNGIAKALGLTRPHVALILKRNLVGQGFVEAKLLHVQGNGRRKLGYMLTPTGYKVVQGKYF